MNMQNPVPTSAFNAYRNWEWFPVAENAQSPREVFRLQRAASSGMVASALAFEAAMFRLRSRYLMLFVTLNYRDELHYQVSLETLQQDRDHLFNNTRSNHMLRGIFGYMWRVEYGEAGGGWRKG